MEYCKVCYTGTCTFSFYERFLHLVQKLKSFSFLGVKISVVDNGDE